jgi:hypothetical protein
MSFARIADQRGAVKVLTISPLGGRHDGARKASTGQHKDRQGATGALCTWILGRAR